VRTWADLLLPRDAKPGAGPRYPAAEIRAAIAAKAKSLRGDEEDEVTYKLGLRGRAVTFPARLDYWLDIAGVIPECERAPTVQACRPLHDRLDEICGSRPRPGSSDPLPQRELDAVVIDLKSGAAELGADDASRRLRLLGSHVAAAARDADWYTKVWQAISDRRRRLVVAAVERDFAQYIRTFAPSLDPADVRLDALWLEWLAREAVRRWGVPEGAGERCMSVA
jgi:hypothetical protein